MASLVLTLPPASAEESKLLRRKYASFPLSKEESLLKKKYDEGKRKPISKDKVSKSSKEIPILPLKRSGSLDSEEIKRETVKKLQALGSLPTNQETSAPSSTKKMKISRRKVKSIDSSLIKETKISETTVKETTEITIKSTTEEPDENESEMDNASADSRSRKHREMVKQSTSFKKGNTIYVTGRGISESVLKKSFHEFGRILSINMEAEKNCAFITFDSYESTSRAINEMDNVTTNGISLKVSYSKKQNFIYIPDKVATISPWARAAAGQVEETRREESRNLVDYEDVF